MRRVQRLEPNVANQIAAGEVVERPASVVKELVENALDAGATRIEIDLEGGGVERIVVEDDGHGMPREDAVLAIERHATSKLERAEDLSSISTLGFRGEALPSIASVSRFALGSRRATDAEGTLLLVEGGQLVSVEAMGRAAGTRVEVRDLFFNVPARLKFLKRPETETSHIVDAVERLALAHPRVSFRLQSGGKTLLEAPRAREEDGRARLERILGAELVAALTPLPASLRSAPVKLHGFVGLPSRTERSMRRLYTFVNGRFVRDRTLQHAIQNVYRAHVPPGRYPVAVLYLEVEPALVDVNVHPQKSEVRFADTSIVHRVVSGSVHAALEAAHPNAEGPMTAPRLDIGGRVQEAWTPFRSSPWGGGMHRTEAPVTGRSSTGEPITRRSRLIGLLGRVGVILESPAGDLVYLDAQRAEQALALHRMSRELALEGRVSSAPLLIPARFESAAVVESEAVVRAARLLGLGFEVEPFGGRTFVLKTAPRALGSIETTRLIDGVQAWMSGPATGLEADRMLGEAASWIEVSSLDEARAADLAERVDRVFETESSPIAFRLSWSEDARRRLLERP